MVAGSDHLHSVEVKELVEVQIVRIPAVSTNKRAYSPVHGGEWGFSILSERLGERFGGCEGFHPRLAGT